MCCCRVTGMEVIWVLLEGFGILPATGGALGRQTSHRHLHGRQLGSSSLFQLQLPVPQFWGLSLSFQRQRQGFKGPWIWTCEQLFVRWSHSQDPRARPNSRFNASVNFGSSNFQQNLNSSQEEYLSNTFQSSLQWTANVPRTHSRPTSVPVTIRIL